MIIMIMIIIVMICDHDDDLSSFIDDFDDHDPDYHHTQYEY